MDTFASVSLCVLPFALAFAFARADVAEKGLSGKPLGIRLPSKQVRELLQKALVEAFAFASPSHRVAVAKASSRQQQHHRVSPSKYTDLQQATT